LIGAICGQSPSLSSNIDESHDSSFVEVPAETQNFEEEHEDVVSEPAAPVVELDSQDSDFSSTEIAGAVEMEKLPLVEVHDEEDDVMSNLEEVVDFDAKLEEVENQIIQLEEANPEDSNEEDSQQLDSTSEVQNSEDESTDDTNTQVDAVELSNVVVAATTTTNDEDEVGSAEEVSINMKEDAEVAAAQPLDLNEPSMEDQEVVENAENIAAENIAAEAQPEVEQVADVLQVEVEPMASSQFEESEINSEQDEAQFEESDDVEMENISVSRVLQEAQAEEVKLNERMEDAKKASDEMSQLNELSQVQLDDAPLSGAPEEEKSQLSLEEAETVELF